MADSAAISQPPPPPPPPPPTDRQGDGDGGADDVAPHHYKHHHKFSEHKLSKPVTFKPNLIQTHQHNNVKDEITDDCHDKLHKDDKETKDTKITSDSNSDSQSTLQLTKGSAKVHSLMNNKKKKKFEETIIDGFAICAFKTWEDLQDDVNERIALSIATNAAAVAANNVTNNDTADKISNSKPSKNSSKHKNHNSNSSTSSKDSQDPTSTKRAHSPNSSPSKRRDHEKAKKRHRESDLARVDDRHQDDPNPENVRKRVEEAREAKEQADRRLSMLQEKLEREEGRSRTNDRDDSRPSGDHNSSKNHDRNYMTPEDYANMLARQTPNARSTRSPQSYERYYQSNEFHQQIKNQNQLLGQDLLRDPAQSRIPYPPYSIESHMSRTYSGPMGPLFMQNVHQSMQSDSKAQNSSSQQPVKNNQNFTTKPVPQSQMPNNQTPPYPYGNQSTRYQAPTSPPPTQRPPYFPTQSNPYSSSGANPFYPSSHLPPYGMHTAQPPPAPPTAPHVPPFGPFSHPQTSSLMSAMSMGALHSPYSSPYIITDTTISRQTSIIPPLHPSMDSAAVAAAARSYGHHPSMLHQLSPYAANSTQSSHPSLYYSSMPPTERSFIEFARGYAGPSASMAGYPGLINHMTTTSSSSTSAPNPTNPYGLDRWPRLAMDHHRAVSRYAGLYQGASTDRSPYKGYPPPMPPTSLRPPSFPSGLFPPPF